MSLIFFQVCAILNKIVYTNRELKDSAHLRED